jgi:hypothetical protein
MQHMMLLKMEQKTESEISIENNTKESKNASRQIAPNISILPF